MRNLLLSLAAGAAIAACIAGGPAVRPATAAEEAAPPPAAPPAVKPDTETAPAASTTGKVVETMNAGTYTYVQVDDGAKKIWAAAPLFAVAVGDTVVVPEGMPMLDFESKTLKRSFDVVYFVQEIKILGGRTAEQQVATAHGASGAKVEAPAVDLSGIQKADGGQTVAEVFANKAALSGKEVLIRGRIVKFTPAVMGKNWIHLQDGTGSAPANDLTVATSAAAAVGDTVLVRGTLSTDKDFGFGYRYDVIVEDAAVTVE